MDGPQSVANIQHLAPEPEVAYGEGFRTSAPYAAVVRDLGPAFESLL
jgi:hypothetical protein